MATDVNENLAHGAHVRIRGEDWLVTHIQRNAFPGSPAIVRVIGTTELVRGAEAAFMTDLDTIELVQPETTRLVLDRSPMFLHGRLHIEATARRTPVGSGDSALRTVGRTLVDDLPYQVSPVHKALEMLRPRILIADAVGLGKTIEVAILLNELALRGAANRVLAIVPQSILEQVQHELWSRTGFPLVRMDTAGIQRMRKQIPAGRNPFAFFQRVIVSIDTIKQPGRYRPFLEEVDWDVVWIDECHSLINRNSHNSQLARLLSARSDGFILTSATPHNGKPESFAELISLLDPTAIADPSDYAAKDIEHLFVRRHRHSPEVSTAVADMWAERKEPEVLPVTPDPAEDAIFTELARTWLNPPSGTPPCPDRLFPWNLFKAALSSPAALLQTTSKRLRAVEAADEPREAEAEALRRLIDLAEKADQEGRTAKLATLLEQFAGFGIAPGKNGRAVVFAERVATLKWLADRFVDLGWSRDQLVVFHAEMPEEARQEAVKEFGMADSKVRLFITGDIASEGVNLHRECHVLVHWDLPWSLIRIQQRNGRIDRYGQRHSPVIKALATVPSDPDVGGDARIIARLLSKEHAAHTNLGDAAAVMGEWDGDTEEKAIRKLLADNASTAARAQAVDAATSAGDGTGEWSWGSGLGELLAAGSPAVIPEVPTRTLDRLLDNRRFLAEVARLQDDEGELDWREEDDLISFVPPRDLIRRFDALPADLVRGLKLHERVKVTDDRDLANRELSEALARRLADRELNPDQRAATAWPEMGYLTDEHPVTAWATDRAMTLFDRGAAPVLIADVTSPVVVCVATWSNKQGEPLVVRWAGIEPDHPIPELVCPPAETFSWLRTVGLSEGLPNTAGEVDLERLQSMVPAAVHAARGLIETDAQDVLDDVRADLEDAQARLSTWEGQVRLLADTASSPVKRTQGNRHADHTRDSVHSLIANLDLADAPSIRVVAVICGANA